MPHQGRSTQPFTTISERPSGNQGVLELVRRILTGEAEPGELGEIFQGLSAGAAGGEQRAGGGGRAGPRLGAPSAPIPSRSFSTPEDLVLRALELGPEGVGIRAGQALGQGAGSVADFLGDVIDPRVAGAQLRGRGLAVPQRQEGQGGGALNIEDLSPEQLNALLTQQGRGGGGEVQVRGGGPRGQGAIDTLLSNRPRELFRGPGNVLGQPELAPVPDISQALGRVRELEERFSQARPTAPDPLTEEEINQQRQAAIFQALGRGFAARSPLAAGFLAASAGIGAEPRARAQQQEEQEEFQRRLREHERASAQLGFQAQRFRSNLRMRQLAVQEARAQTINDFNLQRSNQLQPQFSTVGNQLISSFVDPESGERVVTATTVDPFIQAARAMELSATLRGGEDPREEQLVGVEAVDRVFQNMPQPQRALARSAIVALATTPRDKWSEEMKSAFQEARTQAGVGDASRLDISASAGNLEQSRAVVLGTAAMLLAAQAGNSETVQQNLRRLQPDVSDLLESGQISIEPLGGRP